MKLKKVWHNYLKWEDYKNGMYKTIDAELKPEYLKKAVEFTNNHIKYGASMLRVIKEWPISCEHNLTDTGMNRQAWIGHAGACLEMGFPEDITREAWSYLSKMQQDLANNQADIAIKEWETNYAKQNS